MERDEGLFLNRDVKLFQGSSGKLKKLKIVEVYLTLFENFLEPDFSNELPRPPPPPRLELLTISDALMSLCHPLNRPHTVLCSLNVQTTLTADQFNLDVDKDS